MFIICNDLYSSSINQQKWDRILSGHTFKPTRRGQWLRIVKIQWKAQEKSIFDIPSSGSTVCTVVIGPISKVQICQWASLVAQMVKNLPARQATQVGFLGWEEPLEKEMATHSSVLAWRIPWTEKPGGLQSMGSQRAGHNRVTNTFIAQDVSVQQPLQGMLLTTALKIFNQNYE